MKSRALPQFRMFLRFSGLFLLWSIVVGPVLGTRGGFAYASKFATIGALFGLLLATIAVVVALLYGEVRDRGRFKLAVGISTSALPACLTAAVISLTKMSLPIEFEVSVSESIRALALMSMLPCVIWFSQIAARRYLREISPRKRKQKSA